MSAQLTDVWGRTVTINPGPRVLGLGSRPYSITRQTRRGEVRWSAMWMPNGATATFAGKRDATRYIREMEAAYYAQNVAGDARRAGTHPGG